MGHFGHQIKLGRKAQIQKNLEKARLITCLFYAAPVAAEPEIPKPPTTGIIFPGCRGTIFDKN